VPTVSFGAFQCECQCHLVGGEAFYQEGCGVWTIWYVPEVKNVVKTKTRALQARSNWWGIKAPIEFQLSGGRWKMRKGK